MKMYELVKDLNNKPVKQLSDNYRAEVSEHGGITIKRRIPKVRGKKARKLDKKRRRELRDA